MNKGVARIVKRAFSIFVAMVLMVSATPVAYAFAAQNPTVKVYTSVGAHISIVCASGNVLEDGDDVWYGGTRCTDAVTINGKRYASGAEHIKHLQDSFVTELKNMHSGLTLVTPIPYADAQFEFQNDGKSYEGMLGQAVFVDSSRHVVSSDASIEHASLLINGKTQDVVPEGYYVHIDVTPDQGYEYVPGSLIATAVDGESFDIAVDENNMFCMPSSCVVVSLQTRAVQAVDPDPDVDPEQPTDPSDDPQKPETKPVVPGTVDPKPKPKPSDGKDDKHPAASSSDVDNSADSKKPAANSPKQKPSKRTAASKPAANSKRPSSNKNKPSSKPEADSAVSALAPEELAVADQSVQASVASDAVSQEAVRPAADRGEQALAMVVQTGMAVLGVAFLGGAMFVLRKP